MAGGEIKQPRRVSVEPSDPSAARGLVNVAPDRSAVRTALWRALHVEVDDPPHLLEDEIGLAFAGRTDGLRAASGEGILLTRT